MLHDLKAPVRAMRAFAEALGEDYADKLDSEGREYIGFILSGADDLRAKIEGISAYCKLDKQPLHVTRVDVSSVVADVVANTPVKLMKDATSPGLMVETDRIRLQNALNAVIENAVKFVSPGTQPDVSVLVRVVDGRVIISVNDNGIGVAEADWDRAFEPFVCLNPADDFAGAGMGLSIARLAMRQAGGDMRFADANGEGSVVEIVVGAPA